jgi:hypothetical protein
MKLEGGEYLVLKSLLHFQETSNPYADDTQVAAATKMAVQDVRDWLQTLEGKEFIELARLADRFSACITPKGHQAFKGHQTSRLNKSISAPTVPEQQTLPTPPTNRVSRTLSYYIAALVRTRTRAKVPILMLVGIVLLGLSTRTLLVRPWLDTDHLVLDNYYTPATFTFDDKVEAELRDRGMQPLMFRTTLITRSHPPGQIAVFLDAKPRPYIPQYAAEGFVFLRSNGEIVSESKFGPFKDNRAIFSAPEVKPSDELFVLVGIQSGRDDVPSATFKRLSPTEGDF